MSNSDSDKLKFYCEFRDSFIRMKETEVRQSEQRIRFFLALVTGVLAFIGIFSNQTNGLFDTFWVASISIPLLFTYGLLTFSQVVWSSHVIHNLDITKGILDNLIGEYEPVFKSRIDQSDLRDDYKIIGLTNLKGTFAQYMYLTEGLLAAGFIFLIGTKIFPNQYCLITIIALICSSITITFLIIWGTVIKNGKINTSIKKSA